MSEETQENNNSTNSVSITLATSSTCGPCHMLKSKLEKLGLSVEKKNYSDIEDIGWFRKHGIRNVPCLVVETDKNVEIIQGMEEIIQRIKSGA
jgi:glutaredoxin